MFGSSVRMPLATVVSLAYVLARALEPPTRSTLGLSRQDVHVLFCLSKLDQRFSD